jgi:hypothetical protein
MVLTVLGVGILGLIPMLALLGTMNQRKQLKYERARFAHLKRLSNGRSWR